MKKLQGLTDKEITEISHQVASVYKYAAIKSQSSEYEMDWKSTFRRVSPDNYEFTYTKCGLCELGRRENCFHLIKYLCMTDYVSFDLGGARLVRNHTLANGDECCDFHVFRKEVGNK